MKIELEIKDVDIENALCSAFEGGIAYWAKVGCHSAQREDEWLHQLPLKIGDWGIQLQLREPADGEREPGLLNRETLAKGIAIMAEKHPRHFADLVADDGRQDATTGDVLVQLAVFGEIVYG